jgi:putative chitinase
MITVENFKQVFPHCQDPEGWVQAFTDTLAGYGIDQPHRIAAFIGQCGHESGGWTTFEENLNYSAQGLEKIFGSHFHGDAEEYARQPEKIANRIYCDRMGNGDEASGDGWKYHGRGPIQLTGKANYTKFAQEMFDDWQNLLDNPDWVSYDKSFSLMSAIWFWNAHNLNHYADQGDIKTMTKIINGGFLGLEEREQLYNTLLPYC